MREKDGRPGQRAESGGEEVYCPIRATMDLLGQKWTLHIVRELVSGKKRFNEIAHALGGVNSRTLSKRLDTLQNAGLISRTVRSDIPPWVEYELSAKGRALNDLIDALAHWGRRWMAEPAGAAPSRNHRERARRRGAR